MLKIIRDNLFNLKFARKHYKLFGLMFVLFVVGGLFLGARSAKADVVSLALGSVLNVLSWVLFGVTFLFTKLSLWILEFIKSIAEYNNFMDAPPVVLGWLMVRDIANMFFVVALLIIAFGTILGLEQYEWKRSLIKLVIAAVFINFSKLILQLIIDASQVFTITFYNAFKDAAGGNFINMFKPTSLSKMIAPTGELAGGLTKEAQDMLPLQIFAASVMGVIMAGITVMTLGAYLIILVARIVMLWILMILSPLAFILGTIPAGKSYADEFWRKFTHHVLVAPVMFFFLWLAFATIGNGNIAAQIGVSPSKVGSMGQEAAAVTGLSADPSVTTSEATTWENLSSFAIAIGFLLAGLSFVQQLGVVGGQLTQKAERFGMAVATIASGYAAGRWLVGKGVEKGKTLASVGMFKLGDATGISQRVHDLRTSKGLGGGLIRTITGENLEKAAERMKQIKDARARERKAVTTGGVLGVSKKVLGKAEVEAGLAEKVKEEEMKGMKAEYLSQEKFPKDIKAYFEGMKNEYKSQFNIDLNADAQFNEMSKGLDKALAEGDMDGAGKIASKMTDKIGDIERNASNQFKERSAKDKFIEAKAKGEYKGDWDRLTAAQKQTLKREEGEKQLVKDEWENRKGELASKEKEMIDYQTRRKIDRKAATNSTLVSAELEKIYTEEVEGDVRSRERFVRGNFNMAYVAKEREKLEKAQDKSLEGLIDEKVEKELKDRIVAKKVGSETWNKWQGQKESDRVQLVQSEWNKMSKKDQDDSLALEKSVYKDEIMKKSVKEKAESVLAEAHKKRMEDSAKAEWGEEDWKKLDEKDKAEEIKRIQASFDDGVHKKAEDRLREFYGVDLEATPEEIKRKKLVEFEKEERENAMLEGAKKTKEELEKEQFDSVKNDAIDALVRQRVEKDYVAKNGMDAWADLGDKEKEEMFQKERNTAGTELEAKVNDHLVRSHVAATKVSAEDRVKRYEEDNIYKDLNKIGGEYLVHTGERKNKKTESEMQRLSARVGDHARGEEGKLMELERAWEIRKAAEEKNDFGSYQYEELDKEITENYRIIKELKEKEKREGKLEGKDKNILENHTKRQFAALANYISRYAGVAPGKMGSLNETYKNVDLTDEKEFQNMVMGFTSGEDYDKVKDNFSGIQEIVRKRLKEKADPLFRSMMLGMNDAVNNGFATAYNQVSFGVDRFGNKKLGFTNSFQKGIGSGNVMGTGNIAQDGNEWRKQEMKSMILPALNINSAKDGRAFVVVDGNGQALRPICEEAERAIRQIASLSKSSIQSLGQNKIWTMLGGSWGSTPWDGRNFNVTLGMREVISNVMNDFRQNYDSAVGAQQKGVVLEAWKELFRQMKVDTINNKSVAAAKQEDLVEFMRQQNFAK